MTVAPSADAGAAGVLVTVTNPHMGGVRAGRPGRFWVVTSPRNLKNTQTGH